MWEFEQIKFVQVVGQPWIRKETQLKTLDVQEGNKGRLFADHVTHVCAAHDRLGIDFPVAGTKPRTYEAKYAWFKFPTES